MVVQMVIRELLGERSESNGGGFSSTYITPVNNDGNKMQDVRRNRLKITLKMKRAGGKSSGGGGGGDTSTGGATKRTKSNAKPKGRKSTGGSSSGSSSTQYKSHTVSGVGKVPARGGDNLDEMSRITGPATDQLYDTLRKWRSEVVDNSSGALLPWNVLNNQTLVEISKKVPLSMDELGQIGGVGKKKKEEYGASLLYTVIKFLQDEQVQLNGATMPRLPPHPQPPRQNSSSSTRRTSRAPAAASSGKIMKIVCVCCC
jgi:superfamily II DNA helicase RecQ